MESFRQVIASRRLYTEYDAIYVTWEQFLLIPDTPKEGMERPDPYKKNTPFGEKLINLGQEVDLDFTFKCPLFPNTVLAHCALEFALKQDPSGKIQYQLKEAMLKSYHFDGEYPDADRVTSLAVSVGLNESDVRAYINDPANQAHVEESTKKWRETGVKEIPAYVMNGQLTLMRENNIEAFLKTFEEISEKYPMQEA